MPPCSSYIETLWASGISQVSSGGVWVVCLPDEIGRVDDSGVVQSGSFAPDLSWGLVWYVVSRFGVFTDLVSHYSEKIQEKVQLR